MIHINFSNQKHFWTTNKTTDQKQYTYMEVIQEFYEEEMISSDISKRHEQFLFY